MAVTKFKKVFITDSKSSFEVIDLGDDFFVSPANVFKHYGKLYDTKEDAMYDIFVKRVHSGTPRKNFKKSKYYKMYIERAQIENPEILIKD